ncbi:MAG: hypothetical protein IPF59_02230 [Ignavibacteria bacterium]|nr:hypothetical protein [Ignavibacteria bacterium]
MKNIALAFLMSLAAPAVVLCQSIETFNAIRLEDAATGNTVTIDPSAVTTSYSIVFPASKPSIGVGSEVMRFNRLTQSMSFSLVPQLNLAPQQVAYLDADAVTLRGSANFLWDTTASQLRIGTAGSSSAMQVKRLGADASPLATFEGGGLGIGTAIPGVSVDVDGDFSIDEMTYNATLGATNNDVDFGNTNKVGFVRIASPLTADISLTGMVGGRNGKMIQIYNATTKNIVIVNDSPLSNDTCRFKTSETGNLSIRPRGTSQFTYSAAEQKWIMTTNVNSNTIGFTSGSYHHTNRNVPVPTNNSAYLYLTSSVKMKNGNYNVMLEDGLVVRQIFAVEYGGAIETILIGGPNIRQCNHHDKQADMWVWNGTYWTCYGH